MHTDYRLETCCGLLGFLIVATLTMDETETLFRHWRRQMGLTQLGAAKELGYGVSQIAEFDRGSVRPPLVTLRAMSAAIRGIPPFSLEDAA